MPHQVRGAEAKDVLELMGRIEMQVVVGYFSNNVLVIHSMFFNLRNKSKEISLTGTITFKWNKTRDVDDIRLLPDVCMFCHIVMGFSSNFENPMREGFTKHA